MLQTTSSVDKRRLIAMMALLMAVVNAAAAAGDAFVVRPDDVREAVRAYVAARSSGVYEQPELTFRSVPDSVRVRSADYQLHVESGTSTKLKGAVSFVVTIESGGMIVQRCMVSTFIRTYADVFVATRMIPWRTTVSPDDYRVLRMETTFLDRPVVLDTASLAGTRTRRIVAQGSILYEDLFEPVPLVMQGDRVNVRVRAGSVTLTAEGVAREDGHKGDVIHVSVQGRGERLKAQVQNERTVAVPVE